MEDILGCGCRPAQHTENQGCLADLLAAEFDRGFHAGAVYTLALDTFVAPDVEPADDTLVDE